MRADRLFDRFRLAAAGLAAVMLVIAGCAQGSDSGDRLHRTGVSGKADGPGDIVMSLDRTWIRPAGFITVDVQALDLSGDPTTQWTLTVTPSQSTRVVPAGGNQALVTIEANGIYEIEARNVTSGERTAARVRVDDTPPRVILQSPQRGAFLEGPAGTPVQVKGYVETTLGEVEWVKINHRWFSLDASNEFETTVAARDGINTIVAEAVDNMGNRFRTVTSFVHAPRYESPAFGGLMPVRLGLPTVNLVADLVRELIGGDLQRGVPPHDLTQHMNHPCSETSHLGISVTMDVNSVSLGPVSVQLTPVAGPTARLRAQISVGGETTVLGWARFLGMTHDYILTIGPTTMAATYEIRITPAGEALVTASDVTVNVGETDIDIEWAPDFIAGDMTAKVEGALRTALTRNIPDLVAETLESVSPKGVAVGAQDYFATEKPPVWSYRLAGISTDDTGMVLILDTGAYAGIGWGVPDAPGVAVFDEGRPPVIDTQSPLALATGFAPLNRFLYAIWKGGALSMSFNASRFLPQLDELPLEPWDVTVAVNAMLPPMVSGTVDDRLMVSLGDIQVDLFISSQMGAINATAYLAGEVAVRVTAGDGGIEFETELSSLKMDITHISLPSVDREAIEAYLEPLAQSYLAEVVRKSAFVPMPQIHLGFMGLQGKIQLTAVQASLSEQNVTVHGTTERSYE